jgi:hypothetical protein
MMDDLIIRTLNLLMLVKLLAALETERVTARQRKGFFIIVIIGFEADTAFKDLIHV